MDILAAYRDQINATEIPFIRIVPERAVNANRLTASKFGGIPYLPSPEFCPKSKNREYMKLIAQINLDELISQGLSLKDFPTTGLLQFFVANDEMCGLTFDGQRADIEVVYHESYNAPHVATQEIETISEEYDEFPFQHEQTLRFSEGTEPCGMTESYNCTRFYGNLALTDEEHDAFYDDINNAGCKMGGYAYFTQSDPRDYDENNDWVLLLQIDSEGDIMWGDCGIANWFIRRQDLIRRDFSQILFNWDCC